MSNESNEQIEINQPISIDQMSVLNFTRLDRFIENRLASYDICPNDDTLIRILWPNTPNNTIVELKATGEIVEDPSNTSSVMIKKLVTAARTILKQTIQDNADVLIFNKPQGFAYFDLDQNGMVDWGKPMGEEIF